MRKRLSAAALEQFHQKGYYFPIPILAAEEVKKYRTLLENFEARQGKPISGPQRNKSHLLFTWVDALMRHPAILDAVEDVIGPDILCWNTLFWIKEAHSDSFVSWHQDIQYWGLDTHDLVTAWLALSPASLASGCMRVLAGSHKGDLLPHRDTYHQDNMLTRGQEIAVEINPDAIVPMPLEPGEISLHNVRLAHTSAANQTNDRRIGLSLHYMPPQTKQIVGKWDTAALVRGEDRFGHFEIAPRPSQDYDPHILPFHQKATDAMRDVLFKDAEKLRPTL